MRRKKVIGSIGIGLGVLLTGFGLYKAFGGKKEEVEADSKGIKEELSDIEEFAKLGVTKAEELNVIQVGDALVKARDTAVQGGNTKQAERAQASLDAAAERTYRTMQPWNACKEPKHANQTECKDYFSLISLCQTSPNDERCIRFKMSEAGKRYFGN